MNHLPILVLKACCYVEVSLCSMHMPSGSARRAGSEVSTGQIFPQGALAAATVVQGRAGFGGAGTRTRCEPRLFLGSMEVSALSGVGPGPHGLEQEP